MEANFTKTIKGHDSLAKQNAWVRKEIQSMKRLRAKGHSDFKYMSDTSILIAATKLARIYNVGETYTPAN